MLFQLLDQLTMRLFFLDIDKEKPAFKQELLRANPKVITEIRSNAPQLFTEQELTPEDLSAGYLAMIKMYSIFAKPLAEKVKDQKADSALRCALAGALAYFVQPKDIIPDDAPGGYGLVDDCIMLSTAYIEYLKATSGPSTGIQSQRNFINLFSFALPKQSLPAIEIAMTGVSMIFQLSQMLPANVLDATTQLYITNPLQATTPAPPSGFVPKPAHRISEKTRSGARITVSGDDSLVLFPDGSSVSLVGGRLSIT